MIKIKCRLGGSAIRRRYRTISEAYRVVKPYGGVKK
ncbi:MAG: hypothetical protein H6Q17_2716 [Bacteroidetes bacterium]|nr:hypothetical protein [Bacteroidota bacterium]